MMEQLFSIQHAIQHLIHDGLNYVKLHPNLGFFFAFVVSFTESLPIIGTIIPGSVTMTAIGTLIGAGVLPFSSTFLFAIFGAFAGDFLSYGVGYYYHQQIRNIKWIRKHPNWLQKGEDFFDRHGGKSILIGRFVGPIRSTIPLIAGILRLSPPRFVIASVPSAILWALLYTVPGIVLGALAMNAPKGEIAQFILFGLIVIALLWTLIWLIEKAILSLHRYYVRFCQSMWKHLAPTHGLRRYLSIPNQPNNPHLLHLYFCAILMALFFVLLWIDSATGWGLARFNVPIYYFLRSLHNSHNLALFVHLTLFGNKIALIGMLVLLSIWLGCRRDYRSMVFLWGGFISAAIIVLLLKHIYFHARPNDLMHTASSSFPSGHVCLSMIFYGGLAFLYAHDKKGWQRQLIFAVAISMVTLIALSRLFIGMHWLCDVLASVCLATIILNVSRIVYIHQKQARCQLQWVPLLLAIVIPWGLIHFHSYQYNLKQSTPPIQMIHTTQALWWKQPQAYLPGVRLNRLHHAAQALNIQWLAPLKSIQMQLKKWQPTVDQKNNLSAVIRKLASSDVKNHQGLLQPLHNFRKKTLSVYMLYQGQTLLIQLWPSRVAINNNPAPLWVGNITVFHPPHAPWEKTANTALDLIQFLSGQLHHLRLKTVNYMPSPALQKKLHWDGRVLLIKQL